MGVWPLNVWNPSSRNEAWTPCLRSHDQNEAYRLNPFDHMTQKVIAHKPHCYIALYFPKCLSGILVLGGVSRIHRRVYNSQWYIAGNIVATLGVCCVIYCYLVGSVVVDVCSVFVNLNRWLSLFSVGRNIPYCLVVSLTPCFSSIVLVFISSLLLSLCWAPCWLLVVNLYAIWNKIAFGDLHYQVLWAPLGLNLP